MATIKIKGTKASASLTSSLGKGLESKSGSEKGTGKTSRPTQKVATASAMMKMASDPVRINALLMLAEGDRNVGELATAFGQSQPAISHHLALLRYGGLIQPRRQGKQKFYFLTENGREFAIFLSKLVPKKSRTAQASPIDKSLLEDVGGFVDNPQDWFHTPNPMFEGRKPIDLMGTNEEPRLRNRIEAAKFGMFS